MNMTTPAAKRCFSWRSREVNEDEEKAVDSVTTKATKWRKRQYKGKTTRVPLAEATFLIFMFIVEWKNLVREGASGLGGGHAPWRGV